MVNKLPISVLLVDDDGNIRRTLALSLKDLHCSVEQAGSVEEAMGRLRAHEFDLVLTDFKMEKQTGLELVKQAKALRPGVTVVVMTAFASFENAVEVMKEGAFDYLSKPFTNAQLSHLLSKVRELVALKRENLDLKQIRNRRNYFSGYTSVASQRLEEFVAKIAPTDGTVLLMGESGTGKSELARLIHEHSARAGSAFITVHCTTLTESLLESELFGHMKGSFTGATGDKVGKLELADGGTLFLDEIGELSPNGQAKLLRFLQDRIFERIGGNREITVDARVIAATNKNLQESVHSGKFREDLYYRLNMLECILAPLRHRRDDLPVLIDRILKELAASRKQTMPPVFSKAVQEALCRYSWPGNIRELRNALERAVLLAQGREVQLSDLPESVVAQPQLQENTNGLTSLEELEKRHIKLVLAQAASLEEAAKVLGITTVTLWRKRKEYGF